MNAPRQATVSVVVPCFNGGAFLRGLLDSLDAQTFCDFDVIVVDDGSSDPDTLSVLAAIASRVDLVRQDNRGLAAARNAGFERSGAEFILPLDCDDRIAPAFLAETVAALANSDGDVGFAFTHIEARGQVSGVITRHYNQFDQLVLNQLPYCMLMRRAMWAELGGYDENMRDGYEDWEFNIRALARGWQGIEIRKPLFIYQISNSGMLLGRSIRKHAVLWRYIQQKHRDLYRVRNIGRLWLKSRADTARVSLPLALFLFASSRLLPDRWFGTFFSAMVGFSNRRRAAQSRACAS